MDVYTPDNDTLTERPVVIYLFGGAFITGSKNNIDCVDFCQSFARRGYVTASVNYRLASNPFTFLLNQEEQYFTVLKSVADVKAAIRFLEKI